MERAVDSDPRVSRHATVLRRNYKMATSSGTWETVLIDIGDHEAFPMRYISGRGPASDDEVSLSYSQARAVGAEEGSTVTVQTAQGNRDLTVTGVYQDITNNGKTAKAPSTTVLPRCGRSSMPIPTPRARPAPSPVT